MTELMNTNAQYQASLTRDGASVSSRELANTRAGGDTPNLDLAIGASCSQKFTVSAESCTQNWIVVHHDIVLQQTASTEHDHPREV